MSITLRDDQAQLIERARSVLMEGHKSVLLVAPTGFGKTVCFSHLSAEVSKRNKRVFIIAHRTELLDQISDTLEKFNVPHGFIAAKRPNLKKRPVQVASVQTLVRRLADHKPPDLVIIDEAHHAIAGSTWGKILKAWPQTYRLGVTATPQRLSGHGLRESFERMVVGPSVRELIDGGSLSEYRLFAPPSHFSGNLHTVGGDYAKGELATAMDKPKITGDAVSHYKKLCNGKRAIAFCVSLDHAAHVAQQFKTAGFRSERIDGRLEATTRKNLVRRFSQGEIQILTSCEIVSEGFDLPAIECGILLRPTQSLSLYLQQVGRTLRPFPGKEFSVILDHAGNTLRHGLPDDERDWSLDGQPTKRGKKGEAAPSVRTCGECFAALRSSTEKCPYCGWVFPIESRTIEQVEGELSEVDVAQARLERRREQGRAKSLEELIELGRQRNYKNPVYWATKIWSARGNHA